MIDEEVEQVEELEEVEEFDEEVEEVDEEVGEEIFDIDDFEGEEDWGEGDPAWFFDLNQGLYEVGGIHYIQYDSGFEDDSGSDDNGV